MKQAIINLINALTERIKQHKHEWELLEEAEGFSVMNPRYKWKECTYRCKSCGAKNFINTKEE